MGIISKYIDENYRTSIFFIYGSVAEYNRGYFVEPKDVDIIVVDGVSNNGKEFEVQIPGIPIPVNIKILKMSEVIDEAKSLDPKYLCATYPVGSYEIYSTINDKLDFRAISTIRSSISYYSSAAYNKGKKKLTIEKDYNEYLGLKNILHAFKFPMQAIEYYKNDSDSSGSRALKNLGLVWYITDIRDLIFSTYASSTGTLEERFKTLDAVMKPLYNALMTEFRKIFPKEVNL